MFLSYRFHNYIRNSFREVEIIFNERRLKIVRNLTNNNGEYAMGSMAESFNVTERTIRYDLEEISSFFIKKDIPIYFVIKDGIITIESNIYTRLEAVKFIKDMNLDFYEYLPSSNERRDMILLELFFAEDFITIKYLSDRIHVSPNTIKNDLDKVKDWLIENEIKPTFIPSKGLYIEGEEKSIREAALNAFRKTLSLEQYIGLIRNDIYRSTDNYLGIMFNYIFENINIKKVKDYINILQKKFNIIFSDFIYSDLAMFLGIIIQRIRLGYRISMGREEKIEISKTNIYKKIDSTSNIILKYFNVDLTTDEIIYITQFILSSNIFFTPTIDNYPYLLEHYIYITDLIDQVSKKYNNHLVNNNKLHNDLSIFGLPFYYRQRYKIQAYNPYIKDIKENYKELFETIKSSIPLIKPDMKITINDDEIGFITLYFATALEEPQNRLRAIILCETGLPIGNLLAIKLKLMFNIDVVNIAYVNQGKRILDNEEIDLIITTSPFTYKTTPYVVVSPLLTQEDIRSIRDLLQSISGR